MSEKSWKWKLAEANFTKDQGTVFSCFSCGGGSTMGYKLAGFDVIGNCEIDAKMNEIYVENHKPKFNFHMPIQQMVEAPELPEELYNLTILDGSPPCSSFSISGLRASTWGVARKFREGQEVQVLDELFFQFIALAKRLQPKVVISENVTGLLIGDAKPYVDRIVSGFEDAGYLVDFQVVNASWGGTPQNRNRVIFTCVRKDLCSNVKRAFDLFRNSVRIDYSLNPKEPILWGEVEHPHVEGTQMKSTLKQFRLWELREECDASQGDTNLRLGGNQTGFSDKYLYPTTMCPTFTTRQSNACYNFPRMMYPAEIVEISTFPQDYNFLKQSPTYVCGMSVPPYMMRHIAEHVKTQILEKIK